MSGAKRRWRPSPVGLVALGLLLCALAGLYWPVEVRHSAPFGFSLTFDARRLIAVRGGYVTANYDDFNRVDLDLRAYSPGVDYDLIVHIRPAGPDAPDVRTIPLSVTWTEIWHDKETFAVPFVTVRFPSIPDSAGQRYYVWVEAGPRNRDHVWTLWSIKSYSRVPVHEVLAAAADSPPEPLDGRVGRLVLILLMGGTVATAAWLIAVLALPARRGFNRPADERGHNSLAGAGG